MCLYSHSTGIFGWKNWGLLGVCFPLMLHNIYRLFQICQRFEGWEVVSTQDMVNIVWGVITIVLAVAILYSYAILLKARYQN